MQHRVAGWESRAAGDAVVQPEDAAEQWKASGVARTCSGTAEDVAVRRMPRGMLSGPGETLRNVVGWQWKSRQPGDAVRRQAEDGTMVGGGAKDESQGRRRIRRQKAHQKAEDASGAEAESEMERRGIRGFSLQLCSMRSTGFCLSGFLL